MKAAIGSAKKRLKSRYVPEWNDECEKEYRNFQQSGDREIADNLLHNLNAVRREKRTETVSNLDSKRSSRKAWSLLRKLGDVHKATINAKNLPANKIAAHILSTTRSLRKEAHATQIKRELTKLKTRCEGPTEFSSPVTTAEITEVLENVKSKIESFRSSNSLALESTSSSIEVRVSVLDGASFSKNFWIGLRIFSSDRNGMSAH
ncbi:hypothetical protein JTB14_010364 [Gonioctena quinquepunctata]|nr:hypothetical protein JTB14_010364 [Gonioctena quinquepunctata]